MRLIFSIFSSFNEFEAETLARLDCEDFDAPHSMGMASLPKFASLEATRTPAAAMKINQSEDTILEEAVQNIDLDSTPSRPVQRRVIRNIFYMILRFLCFQVKRSPAMIRPVTWTGNDSVASSDPEEEMHEHEQVRLNNCQIFI